MTNTGSVWCFGNDIDTDILAPGKYMSSKLEILASHCLEALDPLFASCLLYTSPSPRDS